MITNEALYALVQLLMVIAAIGATAFPLLYMFSTWNESHLGRVLMLQGVAFALALDTTVLFTLWDGESLVFQLWANVFIFAFLALATMSVTWMMVRTNYFKHKREQHDHIAKRLSG